MLDYCVDLLYVIADKFKVATNLQLSESTVHHYMRKLNFLIRIAIQKPFFLRKILMQELFGDVQTRIGRLHIGLTFCLRMNLILLCVIHIA